MVIASSNLKPILFSGGEHPRGVFSSVRLPNMGTTQVIFTLYKKMLLTEIFKVFSFRNQVFWFQG